MLLIGSVLDDKHLTGMDHYVATPGDAPKPANQHENDGDQLTESHDCVQNERDRLATFLDLHATLTAKQGKNAAQQRA